MLSANIYTNGLATCEHIEFLATAIATFVMHDLKHVGRQMPTYIHEYYLSATCRKLILARHTDMCSQS